MAFYISVSGSNTNVGRSPSSPWDYATLLGYISSTGLKPADEICFKGGEVFNLSAALALNPTNADSDGVYHISSYGTGRAKLYVPATNQKAINFYNTSGKVSRLDIECVAGSTQPGVDFYSDSSGFVGEAKVEDCHITGFLNAATIGSFGDDNITWDGYIKRVVAIDQTDNCIQSFSNSVNNKSSTLLVQGCYVKPLQGNGIVLSGCSNSTIEYCIGEGGGSSLSTSIADNLIWFYRADNCTIRHCKAFRAQGDTTSTDAGAFGIDIDTDSCVIENCFASSMYGSGALVMEGPNHIVRNNIFIGTSEADMFGDDAGIHVFNQVADIEVYNNVIVSSGRSPALTHGISVENTASTGTILGNIIVSLNAGRRMIKVPNGTMRIIDNAYHSVEGTNVFTRNGTEIVGLANFRSGVQEIFNSQNTGIEGDPQFANIQGRDVADFVLQAGSPLIGTGTLPSEAGLADPDHDFYQNDFPVASPNYGAIQPHEAKATIRTFGARGLATLYVEAQKTSDNSLSVFPLCEGYAGHYSAVVSSLSDGEYTFTVFDGETPKSALSFPIVGGLREVASGGGGGLTTGQANQLSDIDTNTTTLLGRITALRAAQLDNVSQFDASTDEVTLTAASATAAQASLAATNALIQAIPTDPVLASTFSALLANATTFSTQALSNAPTGTGGGSGLSAGQATQLTELHNTLQTSGVFSTGSLVNSPAGGSSSFDPVNDTVTVGNIGNLDVSGISNINAFHADLTALQSTITALQSVIDNISAIQQSNEYYDDSSGTYTKRDRSNNALLLSKTMTITGADYQSVG